MHERRQEKDTIRLSRLMGSLNMKMPKTEDGILVSAPTCIEKKNYSMSERGKINSNFPLPLSLSLHTHIP
jgi:hypothetical protein